VQHGALDRLRGLHRSACSRKYYTARARRRIVQYYSVSHLLAILLTCWCRGVACGSLTPLVMLLLLLLLLQVIWSRTRFVGCASMSCPGAAGRVWACNYSPAGNVIGEYPYSKWCCHNSYLPVRKGLAMGFFFSFLFFSFSRQGRHTWNWCFWKEYCSAVPPHSAETAFASSRASVSRPKAGPSLS